MQYGCSDEIMRRRAETVVERLHQDRAVKPMPAVKLAGFLGLRTENRETLRRRVREAVAFAREALGYRICANDAGYWLARKHSEWEAYRRAAEKGAKFAFVRMRRTERAVGERMGKQGLLFETRAVGW